eukprot:gene5697-6581_t
MRVTWFTQSAMTAPCVQFSQSPFDPSSMTGDVVVADTIEFTEKFWSGFTSTALLSQLSPNSFYYYAAGDKASGSFSPLYNFTTGSFPTAVGQVVPFSFAAYGDMGALTDTETIEHLLEIRSNLSFALHVGDIAYADLTGAESLLFGNQSVWTEFLTEVEPVTSVLPYMLCPGNHDTWYDLQIYSKTFQMPQAHKDGTWYSYDYNGVHFITISSEQDFIPLSPQHSWIEADLKAYRSANPTGWIIAYSHKPHYCSAHFPWCEVEDPMRDLFITGHSHVYERSLPVYDKVVMGTYEEPKATVHLVIGTGGCQEGVLKGWQEPAPSWSANVRISATGYGVVNVLNTTHINFQFVQDSDNQVIDSFVLTKGYFQ